MKATHPYIQAVVYPLKLPTQPHNMGELPAKVRLGHGKGLGVKREGSLGVIKSVAELKRTNLINKHVLVDLTWSF